MFHIKDRNMLSECLLAPNPHTISAGAVGIENGSEICAEDERVRRWSDCELLLDGSVLVDIVYSTVRRIWEIFEVEIVKEALARIIGCLAVLITSCGYECLTWDRSAGDRGVGEARVGLDGARNRARNGRVGRTRTRTTVETASTIAFFGDDRAGTKPGVESTASTSAFPVVRTRTGDVLGARRFARPDTTGRKSFVGAVLNSDKPSTTVNGRVVRAKVVNVGYCQKARGKEDKESSWGSHDRSTSLEQES